MSTSRSHDRSKNPQIFVAKLSPSIHKRELEYEFRKFGRIRTLQLKRGFAFIEFEDYRDADDAIHEMNGRRINGQKIVVQAAHGRQREISPHSRPRRPGPQESDICYNCGKTGHWANECREARKPKGKFYEDKKINRSESKERLDRRSRSRSQSKGSLYNKSKSQSKSPNKEEKKDEDINGVKIGEEERKIEDFHDKENNQ